MNYRFVRRIMTVLAALIFTVATPALGQSTPAEDDADALENTVSAARIEQQKRDHFQEAMRLDSLGAKSTAREMLQSSCYDDLNAEGCHNYANMALMGEGGDTDEARARASYRKACELSSRKSCMNFADMMREGRGGDADLPSAINLYYQLCHGGSGAACHNTALMIESGQGVTAANPEKALEAFNSGCQFGYRPSCQVVEKRAVIQPKP